MMQSKLFLPLLILFALNTVFLLSMQKKQEPLLFAIYTDKKVYYISSHQAKKLSPVFEKQIESGCSDAGFFDLTQYQNGALSPKLMLAIAVLLKQTCMPHEEYQALSKEAKIVGRAMLELTYKRVLDPVNIFNAYYLAYDNQIIGMLNGLEQGRMGYAGLPELLLRNYIESFKQSYLPNPIPEDRWSNCFSIIKKTSLLNVFKALKDPENPISYQCFLLFFGARDSDLDMRHFYEELNDLGCSETKDRSDAWKIKQEHKKLKAMFKQ